MKISVIIPVYNGSLLISRCLDSVFNQSGNYDLEVIVIDDGSTDKSTEIVRNYPKLVRLLQQENKGPAAARNSGIQIANGKYLAFLDADDYWLPGFFEKTIDFLEKNPEAVAANVGQIHRIPGRLNVIAPAILKKNPQKYPTPVLLDDFFEFWAEHNHVCTGSVMMHTDIVKQTGGQRPELRITEDLEFWAYLATFGRWGFIPKVLFVSDGDAVTKKVGWLEKNRKRWSSTPTIDEWESRIIKRISRPIQAGYMSARGRIAGNLAYSMILSNRDNQALETIKSQRKYLIKNRLNDLLLLASRNHILWKVVCKLIRVREYSR